MCGIVGYIGEQKALPILLSGIKNLEYRGYDSAGLAIIEKNGVFCEKAVGRVSKLEEKLKNRDSEGRVGIVHSRWATHGGVSEANAHPHHDCRGNIFIVHNGIIENYKELKEILSAQGHNFISGTDTEVLAHLIEEKIDKLAEGEKNPPLEKAVAAALRDVRGTYGIAVIDSREPDKIVAARNFSPLLIGLGEKEYFVASDASPVIRYTRDVVYLNDGEIAVLSPSGYRLTNLEQEEIERRPDTIEWSEEEIQKSGYPHFMLKEIMEQPEAIENSLRGRLLLEEGNTKLGGLENVADKLQKLKRLWIVACGTAYFAGRVGEYMLEEYAGIPVKVDIASEFRYRKPVFREGDALLVISQSGETADTIAAVREAKEKGILTLGIVNVVGSTVARETAAGVYQHIGPEIAVASTKAFISQLSILSLLTLFLGRQRDMSLVMGRRIAQSLLDIPNLVQRVLGQREHIKELAKKYVSSDNFFCLGRKYNYPIALEGALKIKEIAYVHSEGIAAGEMKHGTIALIDKNLPSIFIVPRDSVYDKNISNIQEIKARRGPVIAIATEGDESIGQLADDVIYIPKTLEMLTPILSVIPLQLLAYEFGVGRGLDVDRPRNLAKSVTVE